MAKLDLAKLRRHKLARHHAPAVPPLADPSASRPEANGNTDTGRQITTVSLYQPDRMRILALPRAVEETGGGRRIDDSKAIRLALRAVEINGPALLAALDSLRADDGRRNAKRGVNTRPRKGGSAHPCAANPNKDES